jgi:pyruvate formate lyase activating enzyme
MRRAFVSGWFEEFGEMTSGLVFDIKEFAIHDGPGIRTTVFMKGCPLSCSWCHNPEGQSRRPQIIRSPTGERLVGQSYTSEELAERLRGQAEILRLNEGGVSFSGGEPLLQAAFVAEVIDQLPGVHILLETSGLGDRHAFQSLVERCDLIYFDMKLIDPETHRRYTGCGNKVILENLKLLGASDKPFVVRIPMVPGVTDTDENLEGIARGVSGLPGLLRVELLPYNRAAGSKYQYAGMQFRPGYDEKGPLNINMRPFEQAGIEARVA